MPSAVYVVDGADLERHYRQSPAAERMGRDFLRPFGGKRQTERIAYRLGQVKSHIYSHYFNKKNVKMRRKTALTSKTHRYPRKKLYLCTDRTRHASRRPANQGGAFLLIWI